MEKHRICKICNRRFANGKAMGGHMRSHLAKHPIPPKPSQQHDNSPPPAAAAAPESTQPSPSSSSSLIFHSINNPMQSYRSVNGELSLAENSDRESENDSHSQSLTRRRSKRRRKPIVPLADPLPESEPVSSVSDAFPEEDVAMCLLMLSRDKWTKGKEKVHPEEGEDDYSLYQIRTRTKFRCETCRKVFRSYQALGGHRASHKKNNNLEQHVVVGEGKVVVDKRVYECPFCFKVFESGQALGGHKKVHFSNVGDARSSARHGDNLIDLNLPAPEDEDEVSQVALSTVSNAA
jgi:uncharacterized CHY-type Zn-finger protein